MPLTETMAIKKLKINEAAGGERKMRKYTSVLLGALICLLSIVFPALAGTTDDFRLELRQAISCPNTEISQPAQHLFDGDDQTSWGFNPGARLGWTELELETEAFIHGLKLTGELGNKTLLMVEYKVGERWLPFLASRLDTFPADGIVDLSYDRVVTEGLRLRLTGEGVEETYFTGLEILGEPADEIRRRIMPKEVIASANTSPFAPARHLCDDNTYTIWQTEPGANQGEVVFTLGKEYGITNINIFYTEKAEGRLRLEAASGGDWVLLEEFSAPQSPGWHRVKPVTQEIKTNKIRLTTQGRAQALGGISQVEIWGYGSYGGNQYLHFGGSAPETVTEPLNFEIALAEERVDNPPIPESFMKVMYRCTNRVVNTNSIQHNFRLTNTSDYAVDLSAVKLRYWYTNEPAKEQVAHVYWSTVGASNVTTEFVELDSSVEGADYYLEVGFTEEAGILGSTSTIEVHLGFNTPDWSFYNQDNDYSFDRTANKFKENEGYTVYVNEILAWGQEPLGGR